MICPACGAENRPDAKFCFECGAGLVRACPNCGSAVRSGARFCDECGHALAGGVTVGGTTPSAPPPLAPSAERRLVSVLFADLVGFTTLSEARDAEEVRDLLTRYFEVCRKLISRYGGTVEKFIGDAVMAVWGTPVAQEDDAERAVRTALDLTAAVAALGQEVGAPELKARAGVLTGEAAVTLGAEGQGMVAGDMVNTASRIQSAAVPGAVYVGEVTRRATEAAVVYEDAGAHELKGKAERIPLWRALRVVAARGGALKSHGLEPPFVGRDRELRLIKDLFHASAEESKAHLLSVIGIAGIGKSRLSWEFFKYVDGLADTAYWHRGRCLAYGEGVTYWALAEMVRMRARIEEGEDPAAALAKLRTTVAEAVPDTEERRWVEPRIAHLLGLEEHAGRERDDLFGAWRLFFERLSEQFPVIMVFEDMQWADPSLLDFVEHLLDWSRTHRVFVMTLARPELSERHPNWAAGQRNFTSLFLEPLGAPAMEDLLTGFVPGLPDELREKILARAEGVPLYAVETVRMLLDRGLLVQEGSVYRPTGAVEALDIPESLHALISARLDGLAPEERTLLQNASVLGKTFSKDALSAITGFESAPLEALLTSLIRKEVLSLQTDPRAPERGQYGFLQDLVKRVAYETLSKKDRRARHLTVASYLRSNWGPEDDEIVEVVASHYLEAYRAAPEAPDAEEIKAQARDTLARAGERAASLAAAEEASHYFEQALELSDDPVVQAALRQRLGDMGWRRGLPDVAKEHYEQAISLFRSRDMPREAARASVGYADISLGEGRIQETAERLEEAYAVLSGEEPDEVLARVLADLGRVSYFQGDRDRALERIEQALTLAETLQLPEVLSQALNTRALAVRSQGRHEEATLLLRHALQVALDNDLPQAALRAHNNLGYCLETRDRFRELLDSVTAARDLAARIGDRPWQWKLLAGDARALTMTGEWDEALSRLDQVLASGDPATIDAVWIEFLAMVPIHVARGDLAEARAILDRVSEEGRTEDVQTHAGYSVMHALVLRAEGRFAEALAEAEQAVAARVSLGAEAPSVKEGFAEAIEAALALGDLDRAAELLGVIDSLRPGEVSPFLTAEAARLRTRYHVALGETDGIERGFLLAAEQHREQGLRFWLGLTLVEHGEWLVSQGRGLDAEPLLREAGEIFEWLRATPWIERTRAALALAGVPVNVAASPTAG